MASLSSKRLIGRLTLRGFFMFAFPRRKALFGLSIRLTVRSKKREKMKNIRLFAPNVEELILSFIFFITRKIRNCWAKINFAGIGVRRQSRIRMVGGIFYLDPDFSDTGTYAHQSERKRF